MRFLASIRIEGFYVGVHSPREDEAFVVHRSKAVLDASGGALRRGVQLGMPLSEARSILAESGRFVEWQEEDYRAVQRRWLEVVAEFSDTIEPIRQHEALADLSGHPRPREAAQKLEEALKAAGFAPHVGLASCRWVARLAARRGDPLGLAHADPRSYVADVPVSLLPVLPNTAKRLELLGYRTAEQVTALSTQTLRAQFGQEAHGIAQAAAGRGDSQVKARFPEACVGSRFSFESVPESRREVDDAIALVAREIGGILRSRDMAGRTVELFLEREDGGVAKTARAFARTISGERDVANALALMLPDGPEEGVAAIRARMPGLRSTRRVQLDIHGGRSKRDGEASLGAAIAHVRGAFGDGAVRLVGEIPLTRRERVRRAYRDLNRWVWR